MIEFDPTTFTYGFEMEMGDVDRTIIPPPEWGIWEHCEVDIVNMVAPYRGITVDPQGVDPPVGGEVNTMPTLGWQPQVERILKLYTFFKERGRTPTCPFSAYGHVHCHVPGLIEDMDALKNLMLYIRDNQEAFVNCVAPWRELPEMKQCPEAMRYLKFDGRRMIPDWRIANIIRYGTDFQSFIHHHSTDKTGTKYSRAARPAINTSCLQYTKTIEFRSFWSSFEELHLRSSFEAVAEFMNAALNTDEPWSEIEHRHPEWEFPPMTWETDLALGWAATHHRFVHDQSKGKNRIYYDAS